MQLFAPTPTHRPLEDANPGGQTSELGRSWPQVGHRNPTRAQNSSMRVALALGSGGARGYAHIGVINELHERG
ncbi:MAG: hypothetical protein K0U84_09735, partial [Actinomycetia bacterium]|nr:hypothetical protein [Actinomycetes bacterium]